MYFIRLLDNVKCLFVFLGLFCKDFILFIYFLFYICHFSMCVLH